MSGPHHHSAPPPKPTIPPFTGLPNIPALEELKARRQWVCWQYEKRVSADGTIVWTKPPVSALTGYKTSVTEAKNWATYQRALDRVLRDDTLAGIGFALRDGEIKGVDLDGCRDPETGKLQAWAQVAVDFGETYCEVSPSGCGLRFFVKGEIASCAVHSAQVELYESGRYLTVTGRPVEGSPVEIREAPRLIAYLTERAEQFRAAEKAAADRAREAERQRIEKTGAPSTSQLACETVKPPPGGGSSFFRTVNDKALADLDAWVPILLPAAKHQGSTRGYRVKSKDLGRNLQEDLGITPQGIKDWGVADMGDARLGARSPIDLVIEYGEAADPISAARWLCTQMGVTPEALGWRDETLEIGKEAAEMIVGGADGAAEETATEAEQSTEQPAEEPEAASPRQHPLSPLDSLSLGQGADWTRPAGLLKGLAEWILASSRRPNRPMAVAAATSVLSAVCGRHLYGPTGTALNLYLVMLGGTTVGKGRPLSAPAEILTAANLGDLATTAKGFSVSAIERMIAEKPACLATADEIGANLLGRMAHRGASTHESAMRGALLELWSREQGQAPWSTTRSATRQAEEVWSPSLTILGASTPEAFYGSLTSGSVRDGFLNRFLLAEAAPRGTRHDPDEGARVVPDVIKIRLAQILPCGEGNLGEVISIFSPLVHPPEDRLAWDGEDTRERANAFEEEILDLMDANPEEAPLIGRLFEQTIRLASLHAVSREGRRARVSLDDLQWGASWAVGSVKAMLAGAAANMAGSEYEQKFNAVRKTIQRAPGGTITQRELLRQNRTVSANDRDQILKHLKGGGFIEETDIRTSGRAAIGYRWIG